MSDTTPVERVELVPEGPTLSRLVQGYWRLDSWSQTPQDTLRFLQQHAELGVTSIDHADIYGDYQVEALFGRALALAPAVRQQIEIVTKCDINLLSGQFPQRQVKHYDTSREHILASAHRSLEALGVETIDVLLLHRPDPLMDADEVAEAFNHLRQAGKVRHFGVSNFSPSAFELLQSRLDTPLVTNQIELNPFSLDALPTGTLDHLQRLRVRPMGWSCLAGGRLFSDDDAASVRLRSVLAEIGEELGGVGIDQVAYAWVLRLPCGALPVLGSGRIERVRDACDALSLNLSREQWFRIFEAARGYEVP